MMHGWMVVIVLIVMHMISMVGSGVSIDANYARCSYAAYTIKVCEHTIHHGKNFFLFEPWYPIFTWKISRDEVL
jgi:hypothetical protein